MKDDPKQENKAEEEQNIVNVQDPDQGSNSGRSCNTF